MLIYLTLTASLLVAEALALGKSTEFVSSCFTGNDLTNLKNESCGENVTDCYYTVTIPEKSLTYNMKHSKPDLVYNMSCDFSSICNNTFVNQYVEIKDNTTNSTTHQFCCNRNNCNKPVRDDVKRKCYNAYKRDNISEGSIEECLYSDAHCSSFMTHIESGEKLQYYSCEHNLGFFNVSCGSSQNSHCNNVNVSVGGVELKAELCCCYGDLCMTPPFNYTNSNTALNLTYNGTIWIADNKIEHPTPKNKKYTDWLFYGGLIAAALLIVLIIVAAIIIGVKCRKKKETNRLMLAYTRIAADETPDDDADVRMLLG
ncbi:uncharacterized protein LOC127735760 [Mytilus californianus]|uniref:uncharacterized protein LOC127735760 n=1 Tax=Mytilus californianus TaxID=6549 RepID=UPI00224578A9|nr:uncharacterized protein LOC127735760 [Mytilus californianus]